MKFKWQEHLTSGVYVDVRDTYKNWCLGYIEDFLIANNTIRVRFDGWLSKYIEVLL